MATLRALAAALVLAAPPAASGETGAARLLISATVVRSIRVSVSEAVSGSAAVRVSTSGGAAWAAELQAAAGVPGVGVSRSAADPSYVVVTVLADGPFPAQPGGSPDGRKLYRRFLALAADVVPVQRNVASREP